LKVGFLNQDRKSDFYILYPFELNKKTKKELNWKKK